MVCSNGPMGAGPESKFFFEDWIQLKKEIMSKAKMEEVRLKHASQLEDDLMQQKLNQLKELGLDKKLNLLVHEMKEKKRKECQARLQHWTAKWKLEGERVSKTLMKRVKIAKSRLILKSIWNQKKEELKNGEARQFISNWYRDLYGQGCLQSEAIKKLEKIWAKRIQKFKVSIQTDQNLLERMMKVTSRMRKQKAAGEDGIPAELYQRCPALLESLWRVWVLDCDRWSSRVGIITLIHKKADKRTVENWRPITLLNVDHKILAASLNNVLKWIASKVVGKFQHGFIPGRRIHEAILRIKAAQFWSLIKHKGGILCIDFQKAYDSVFREWDLDHNGSIGSTN